MIKKQKNETVKVMDSVEATISKMERFNPYQSGHGEIVSPKYKKKGRQSQKDKKALWEF